MPAALSPRLRLALNAGLVAGIAMVYISLVGLSLTFAERPVVTGVAGDGAGVLTLGRLMLATMPFFGGLYVAGRMAAALHAARSPRVPVMAALGGAVAGLTLGLFILAAGVTDLSGTFIQLTERLLNFLTFDQQPILGVALWTVISAAMAAAGAVLRLLDARARGVITSAVGLVLLVSVMEPIIRPILGQLDLTAINQFVFEGGGITIPAAVVGLVLVGAAAWAWSHPAASLRARIGAFPPEQRRWSGLGFMAVGAAALLILPQISTGFVSLVLVNVGFYLVLALGLNIVVGYAGLLDLGYVAFYAVGAYTVALLVSPSSSLGGPLTAAVGVEWAFWLALPIVMLVAAMVGIFIGAPVLRLRGDYLAIVTLGFGEIARILFGSDALRPWVGGSGGVVGIPNLHIPIVNHELTSSGEYFYPVIAFGALAAFIAWRLSVSRTGRAWNAMREDETVAAATGINITNYKLLAFALGGTLGGISGALFAVQLRSVYPGSFLLIVSITTLAIIILGGMGTIRGVIAGALILVGLPEALRDFGEYRFLIYGAALVAMMVLRPEGLFPSRTRQMELHEDAEPDEPDQLGDEIDGLAQPAGEPIVTGGRGVLP